MATEKHYEELFVAFNNFRTELEISQEEADALHDFISDQVESDRSLPQPNQNYDTLEELSKQNQFYF